MKFTFKILFLFLLSISLNAQKIYYKTFEGNVLTEENYLANMKEIEERKDLAGRVYEIPLKTEHKEDSIIKHVKFELITFARDKEGNKFDPYGFQREMIGTHFPIESFKDENGDFFPSEYLNEKPSVVNFWFTDCPPCIAEIPVLANLKNEFGDSVNFIAITFEAKKDVKSFLKHYPSFEYFHITNAVKPINKLKIRIYPMTFLINKDGEVVNLYGDLTHQSQHIKEILLRLL